MRRNRQSRTFLVENVIGELWSELEEGRVHLLYSSVLFFSSSLEETFSLYSELSRLTLDLDAFKQEHVF